MYGHHKIHKKVDQKFGLAYYIHTYKCHASQKTYIPNRVAFSVDFGVDFGVVCFFDGAKQT